MLYCVDKHDRRKDKDLIVLGPFKGHFFNSVINQSQSEKWVGCGKNNNNKCVLFSQLPQFYLDFWKPHEMQRGTNLSHPWLSWWPGQPDAAPPGWCAARLERVCQELAGYAERRRRRHFCQRCSQCGHNRVSGRIRSLDQGALPLDHHSPVTSHLAWTRSSIHLNKAKPKSVTRQLQHKRVEFIFRDKLSSKETTLINGL